MEKKTPITGFTPKGDVQMKEIENGLWFTVNNNAFLRSYVKADGVYKIPFKIDMTVTLDAPGFYLLIGETGRINFCSAWDDNRRMEDVAGLPQKNKPRFFANQMPLNTPNKITVIYNLKSMQILINGEQRYYSTKERYMKSPEFINLNAAGFPVRLTCFKRTEAVIHAFTVTEKTDDFEIAVQEFMPEPVMRNIDLPPGEKPTFEAMISGLPNDIREKVMEIDGFLRSYKPLKFKRALEKNGNKISYVAPEAGVSYAIYLSRDTLNHSLQWYILTNSKENWGKRVADDLVATLEKLAAADAVFAGRIFSYLTDCTGCTGPNCGGCGGRSPYTFNGATKQSCHGKIMFKMALSEFDDVRRLIEAIKK